MINYLFCDEGGKYQTGPVVSFAGVAVSPSRLETFNNDWNSLLRSYDLESIHMRVLADVYSAHGPKFPRDQTVDQRIEALLPFADCINKHLEIGLIETWDVAGHVALPVAAKARIGGSDDPHYLAFVRGILQIVEHLDADDRINVICDDDLVKAWDCYLHYRAVCAAMPELRKKFASLSFARDENFPALQAADMVAFLSRLEASNRFHGKVNEWLRLFEHLTTDPTPECGAMRWFALFANEQQLMRLANGLSKPLDAT
jgi:hypothetical protein